MFGQLESILNISLKKTALLGGHSPRLGISCLIYSRRSDLIERKSTLVFKCSSFSDIMAKWSIGFRVILSVLVGPPSVWSKITNKNKAVKPSLEAVWVCQEPLKLYKFLKTISLAVFSAFLESFFFEKVIGTFLFWFLSDCPLHSMMEWKLLWKKGTPKILSKSISRMPMGSLDGH